MTIVKRVSRTGWVNIPPIFSRPVSRWATTFRPASSKYQGSPPTILRALRSITRSDAVRITSAGFSTVARFDPETAPRKDEGHHRLDIGQIDDHPSPHLPEDFAFFGMLRQVLPQQISKYPCKGDLAGPVFDDSLFHAVPHTTDASDINSLITASTGCTPTSILPRHGGGS